MSDYNASERRHVRSATKAAKLADIQRRDFLIASLATGPGRLWFHDLLVRCHLFHNPHSGNALNTAFACGEMNIGQQILIDIMKWCPDQYIQLMREANARDALSEQRRSAVPDGGDQVGGDTGPDDGNNYYVNDGDTEAS